MSSSFDIDPWARRAHFPFTGTGAAWVLVAALAPEAPFGSLVMLLLPQLLFLPIVRGVALGSETMPGLAELRQWRRALRDWGRTIAVTGVMLWPLPAAYALAQLIRDLDMQGKWWGNFGLVVLLLIALPVMGVRYPPRLAALAIFGRMLEALDPGNARRVRKELIAHDVATATTILIVGGGFGTMIVAGMLSTVPYAGGTLGRLLWVWLAFQVAYMTGLSLRGRVSREMLEARR